MDTFTKRQLKKWYYKNKDEIDHLMIHELIDSPDDPEGYTIIEDAFAAKQIKGSIFQRYNLDNVLALSDLDVAAFVKTLGIQPNGVNIHIRIARILGYIGVLDVKDFIYMMIVLCR